MLLYIRSPETMTQFWLLSNGDMLTILDSQIQCYRKLSLFTNFSVDIFFKQTPDIGLSEKGLLCDFKLGFTSRRKPWTVGSRSFKHFSNMWHYRHNVARLSKEIFYFCDIKYQNIWYLNQCVNGSARIKDTCSFNSKAIRDTMLWRNTAHVLDNFNAVSGWRHLILGLKK